MDLSWWQILIGAIVGLLILTILVVVHELGHAITAKRNGVEVEEFGIGFPPRALTLGKVKGTLVTLNWLPLGGFCKMKGESDDAKGKGTYGEALPSVHAQQLPCDIHRHSFRRDDKICRQLNARHAHQLHERHRQPV